MPEVEAGTATPSTTPEAAPATPAEVVTDQNTAVEAAAPSPGDGEKPATDAKPEADPERAKQSKFDRKINRLYREAAEQKARADLLEQRLSEFKPKEQDDASVPKLEHYDFDAEKYAQALADYKLNKTAKEATERQAAETQRATQQKLQAAWEKTLNKAEDKYDDFDQVVGELKPTTPWALAIMRAENGDDVAYHLGKNMAEAQRIIALDPIDQFLEIGRLSAKLALQPATPKEPSKAPAPIKPVGGNSKSSNDLPSDSDDINTWMKKERAREKRAMG
jgi:hypothetical protein